MTFDTNEKIPFEKKTIDDPIFKDGEDYWQVADQINNIYYSEGSLTTLIDFERVLNSLDIYAFKNWELGELVQGPIISRYKVSCIFLWPESLMPDPRGARRLLPFDCEVKFKRTLMKIPMKISNPDDYIPGTKKARIVEKRIWLVQISMPKTLMGDIKTGSLELEGQKIDLDELDAAYGTDADQEIDQGADQMQSQPMQTDAGM